MNRIQPNTPLVFIILLNWNNAHYTLPCLDSLKKLDYANYRVIVVDNGSKDGSPATIRAQYPDVEVIELDRNQGFCEGNNVGFRRALQQGANYLLELNNDTEVAPDFLTRMVEIAEQDAQIGVVGPKIYYYDQPGMIWSAGGLVGETGEVIQLGLDQPDNERFNTVRDVDFVTGCALLVKSQVAEKAGLNEPDIFIYYDEIEWCARIRQAGYRVVYTPAAVLWHKISQQTRTASRSHVYLITRNRLYYLKKIGAARKVILGVTLLNLRMVMAWLVKPAYADRRNSCIPVLRAMLDFYANRFGPGPYQGK